MSISDFDTLLAALKDLRTLGHSYQRIGDAFGVNKTTIWKIINERRPPVDHEIRRRLGLSPSSDVILLEGEHLNGATLLAHHIKICPECGQPYIPNHPKRNKCFICSPYRGS